MDFPSVHTEKSWRNDQIPSSNLLVVCQENLDYWLSCASVTPNFKICRTVHDLLLLTVAPLTPRTFPFREAKSHPISTFRDRHRSRNHLLLEQFQMNTNASTTYYRENQSGSPLSAANPNKVFDLFLPFSTLHDSVEGFCFAMPERILLAPPASACRARLWPIQCLYRTGYFRACIQ